MKFKAFILVYLVSLMLPAEAITCNKIARRYTANVGTLFGSVNYNISVLSKITKKMYSVKLTDTFNGETFNARWIKECNQLAFSLPVLVEDSTGIVGPAGAVYQFDYVCLGSVAKSAFVSGTCSLINPNNNAELDRGGVDLSPSGGKRFRTESQAIKLDIKELLEIVPNLDLKGWKEAVISRIKL